jgi:hypothetical protein
MKTNQFMAFFPSWTRATRRPLSGWSMFGIYTLIALAMSWPLPRFINTHVPYGGGDDFQYMWNMWWFRQALQSGTNPFQTSLLYYPYGVNLAFSTQVPLVSAFTVPLQWLGVNLVACYNVAILLSSVIAAWAMWALARRLTGSSLADFVPESSTAGRPTIARTLWGTLIWQAINGCRCMC